MAGALERQEGLRKGWLGLEAIPLLGGYTKAAFLEERAAVAEQGEQQASVSVQHLQMVKHPSVVGSGEYISTGSRCLVHQLAAAVLVHQLRCIAC